MQIVFFGILPKDQGSCFNDVSHPVEIIHFVISPEENPESHFQVLTHSPDFSSDQDLHKRTRDAADEFEAMEIINTHSLKAS